MVANSGVHRGEVWWARPGEPAVSEPGHRRPVIVLSSDDFNRSRIKTVLAAVLTTNLRLAEAPGSVIAVTAMGLAGAIRRTRRGIGRRIYGSGFGRGRHS